MKATEMDGKTEARVLKEIRAVLLRIEEHLLKYQPKKEKSKKQLLND